MRVTTKGDIHDLLESEVRAVAGAMRRAATTTGRDVQAQLRAQARAAGFKDGGRSLAGAWRLKIYPPPGVGPRTWRPAAAVMSNMPEVAEVFAKGVLVSSRRGRFMAWPTGYNATSGRRNAGKRGGVRVTIDQMKALSKKTPREAFVVRAKSNPNVYLWCLKIYEARGLKRRSRLKIFAGSGDEVFTGNRKGRAAAGKELLKRGFVPMYFLKKQVILRKRYDIEAIRAAAPAQFAANALRELAALD